MHVVDPTITPLGAAGSLSVQRTIPTRGAHRIGAWVFVDHYAVTDAPLAMNVGAHPHTGLQTASWVFDGIIEHRDSAGVHEFIKPGELNLMTAGRGIAHSEHSVSPDGALRGVQLWIALPEEVRFAEPAFAHFVPVPVHASGCTARVFLGATLGATSPVATHTPLLGAQLDLDPGTTLALPLDASFEHGVLVDRGTVTIADEHERVQARDGHLVVMASGATEVLLRTESGARLVLLGGEPFTEPIIMLWNLIARTHEEITAWRAQWLEELAGTATTHRFGLPVDDIGEPEPVPSAPGTRLRPRR